MARRRQREIERGACTVPTKNKKCIEARKRREREIKRKEERTSERKSES